MKLIITAFFLACFLSTAMAQAQDEAALRSMLRSEAGRAVFTRQYHESTPEDRRALRGRVVALTRKDVFGARQERPLLSMSDAAAVLMAMGDDESTISALQVPGCLTWDEQMDAAAALSVCRDDRALVLMEGLVTHLEEKLGDTLVLTNDDAEKRSRNDRLGFYCEVLKSMARSANPAGMPLARKHRDAFAALYPSANGRLVVSLLDAEFAEAAKRKAATLKEAVEAAAAAKGKQGAVPDK